MKNQEKVNKINNTDRVFRKVILVFIYKYYLYYILSKQYKSSEFINFKMTFPK